MSKIEIFAVPDLYTSHRKLIERLERSSLLDLFLNQPKDLEPYLTALARDELSYGDLIQRIREDQLIPEPIDSWRYPVEQLLKSLPRLKGRNRELRIHCYVNPDYHKALNEKASEVARLTLRSNITGRIEVEEWETNILDWLGKKCEELEKEADLIGEGLREQAVCVTGYDGKVLEELLTRRGHEVTWRSVEEFYHPKPMEALGRNLEKSRGSRPKKETRNLIMEHLKYVKE